MESREEVLGGAGGHGLDCAAARKLVHEFLAGEERIAERALMRGHLARCADCRTHYETGVRTLARLASRGGDAAFRLARQNPSTSGRSVSGRPQGLARMVLPALGLLALWAIAGSSPTAAPIEVTSLGGAVRVGREWLERDSPARLLVRGQTCSTPADARARITCGGVGLWVEPSSDLMIEHAVPLRVRLFAGTLLYTGPIVVVSSRGVLEAGEGRGLVHLDGDTLSIASVEGQVRLTHPTGDHLVLPGRPLRLTRSGANAAD